MKNFLENNQKHEIRATISIDIILYEPNELQLEELRNILSENLNIDENFNAKGEISLKYIRYIIRELVKDGAFIDEYNDDQLSELIENGNKNIKRLLSEISDLLHEISEDMLVEKAGLISTYSQIGTILNSTADMNMMQNKFDKLFKKNGYDVKFEDLMNGNITPELLESKKIKTKKKNKK